VRTAEPAVDSIDLLRAELKRDREVCIEVYGKILEKKLQPLQKAISELKTVLLRHATPTRRRRKRDPRHVAFAIIYYDKPDIELDDALCEMDTRRLRNPDKLAPLLSWGLKSESWQELTWLRNERTRLKKENKKLKDENTKNVINKYEKIIHNIEPYIGKIKAQVEADPTYYGLPPKNQKT